MQYFIFKSFPHLMMIVGTATQHQANPHTTRNIQNMKLLLSVLCVAFMTHRERFVLFHVAIELVLVFGYRSNDHGLSNAGFCKPVNQEE